MKRLKNKFLRAFFSCCLLFALLTAAQAAEPTPYEGGAAGAALTPPVSSFISSFSGMKPSPS